MFRFYGPGEIIVDLTNCVGYERFSHIKNDSCGRLFGCLTNVGYYVQLSELESQAILLKNYIDLAARLGANEAQATRCAIAQLRGYGWFDRRFVHSLPSVMDELNFDFGLFADPHDGDGDD